MKNKKRMIAALALSACVALGVVGFAACSSGENGKNGKSAYEIAVEHGFDGTEAEWLESLKGTNGTNGKDGENGVDGTNGTNGTNGENGKDGNGWHYGYGEPAEEVGMVGDLYLNLENGDVWTKGEDGWTVSKLNIVTGERDNSVKNFGEVTISAGGTYDLDLTDVEPGAYYLVATTSETPASGVLTARTNSFKYDMYNFNNVEYKSIIIVNEETTAKTTLSNATDADLTVSVKLFEYVAPVIVAGQDIDVPALHTGYGYVPVTIDSSLAGKKVKIYIKNWVNTTIMRPFILDNTEKHNTLLSYTASDKEGDIFVKEYEIPADLTEICFRDPGASKCSNITVYFEIVD